LFVDDMQARRRIDSPIGFIWRAAELKAQEESRRLRREQATDPNRLSGRIVSALPADPGPAIQEARRLLPRIRGDGARNVLALILDAMEAERQMLSNIEIAEILQMSVVNARQLRKRAFDRLILLAREEQKAGRGFHLPELDDDEELLVATDDIEGDEE
jgi:hypothetical protein